eukprot:3227244-Alexandrium_andersonii.AAC.1
MIPAAEPPAALLGSAPAKPDLNVLVWSTAKVQGCDTLKLPEAAAGRWNNHPEYGPRVQEFLKQSKVASF